MCSAGSLASKDRLCRGRIKTPSDSAVDLENARALEARGSASRSSGFLKIVLGGKQRIPAFLDASNRRCGRRVLVSQVPFFLPFAYHSNPRDWPPAAQELRNCPRFPTGLACIESMKRARPNLFSLNPNSSDDDSGENLMEDLESDYVAIPELDHYDENILDHREYGAIDPKARRAAEVRYMQLARFDINFTT